MPTAISGSGFLQPGVAILYMPDLHRFFFFFFQQFEPFKGRALHEIKQGDLGGSTVFSSWQKKWHIPMKAESMGIPRRWDSRGSVSWDKSEFPTEMQTAEGKQDRCTGGTIPGDG